MLNHRNIQIKKSKITGIEILWKDNSGGKNVLGQEKAPPLAKILLKHSKFNQKDNIFEMKKLNVIERKSLDSGFSALPANHHSEALSWRCL